MYRLNETTALIQTVDFFTPIVDDPFDFGRIAAANALSDVYAMGGRPLLCMNILACPVKTMAESVFRQVVEGGLAKIREAGALLVGGHSIEDDELKYGLSVTGLVHPERVLLNSGARPGDVLLLTKPLGTGILSTALKGGLAGTDTDCALVELMATLNRLPMEILDGDERLRAAASGVSIHLDPASLPVLAGAREFADMGIIPEGAYRNRTFYRPWVRSALGEHDPLEMIVHDPQTSGGLLLAMEAAAGATLCERLRGSNGAPACALIGTVRAGDLGRVVIG